MKTSYTKKEKEQKEFIESLLEKPFEEIMNHDIGIDIFQKVFIDMALNYKFDKALLNEMSLENTQYENELLEKAYEKLKEENKNLLNNFKQIKI